MTPFLFQKGGPTVPKAKQTPDEQPGCAGGSLLEAKLMIQRIAFAARLFSLLIKTTVAWDRFRRDRK